MWYMFFAAHLLICMLLFLGIHFRVLKVHKYMFFIGLCLPFWGVLIILILHFQVLMKADSRFEVGGERFKLESEIYKRVFADEKKESVSTVPIEEALVINSARERRSIIMDILNENPKEYSELLQKAGNNEDTEVVHYAVTAMVEISKENDYMLQKFEEEYANHPDDMHVLNKYIDFLWDCLSQNLMQGQVEIINRDLFSTLIYKKISLDGTLDDYIRAVENDLKLGRLLMVDETLCKMETLYSEHEEYYLLRIQYYASLGRGDEIQKLLREISNRHIYLSSKTKEVIAFWEG